MSCYYLYDDSVDKKINDLFEVVVVGLNMNAFVICFPGLLRVEQETLGWQGLRVIRALK